MGAANSRELRQHYTLLQARLSPLKHSFLVCLEDVQQAGPPSACHIDASMPSPGHERPAYPHSTATGASLRPTLPGVSLSSALLMLPALAWWGTPLRLVRATYSTLAVFPVNLQQNAAEQLPLLPGGRERRAAASVQWMGRNCPPQAVQLTSCPASLPAPATL